MPFLGKPLKNALHPIMRLNKERKTGHPGHKGLNTVEHIREFPS